MIGPAVGALQIQKQMSRMKSVGFGNLCHFCAAIQHFLTHNLRKQEF